jgi:hypothetical protein
MKIVRDKIAIEEIEILAQNMFGNMVKAVVDLKQEIMAVGGELHSDEESLLMEGGSKNSDLWGINIYPELKGEEFIEFDSMINLRPAQGNCTRGIEDPQIRGKIVQIVNQLVQK